jgi:hypothetical protein
MTEDVVLEPVRGDPEFRPVIYGGSPLGRLLLAGALSAVAWRWIDGGHDVPEQREGRRSGRRR